MTFPLLNEELVFGYLLVFLRINAVLFLLPVLGDKVVPAPLKGGISFIMALVIYPVVRAQIPTAANLTTLNLIGAIVGEILIGVIIGFAIRLVFSGIQMAGEMVGFQMGFSIANVIDPYTNVQVSLIGDLLYLFAILVFLNLDGHHLVISALVQSYDIVQPLTVHFTKSLTYIIIDLSRGLFVIAVKVSAPVMAALFFTNVAMGIVARTVPQMNVFIVSFPLQIFVGLLTLSISLSLFRTVSERLFHDFIRNIFLLLRHM